MSDSSKPPTEIFALTKDRPHELSFKPSELPEETAARLRIMERDASFDNWKDIVVTGFSLLAVGTVIGFALYFLVTQPKDSEAVKWATTTLVSLLTGAAGYSFGKSEKKK